MQIFIFSEALDINKRLKLRLDFFNNNDAKNSQINQVLSTEQKKFLVGLGDSIQKAFYQLQLRYICCGKILYEKVYFNPGPGLDSFYQYSTDPALAKYNLDH